MDCVRAPFACASPATSAGNAAGSPIRSTGERRRLAALAVLVATLQSGMALAAIGAGGLEATGERAPAATDTRMAQQGPARWEPRGEPVFPPLGYDPAAEWAARRKQQQPPAAAPATPPARTNLPATEAQSVRGPAAVPPATATIQTPAAPADTQRQAGVPMQPAPHPYHAGYAPPGMPPYEAMQPMPPQWQPPPQAPQPQPYAVQPGGNAGIFHPQAPSHAPYPQGPYPAVAPVWTPYGWQWSAPAYQPQQPAQQHTQTSTPPPVAPRGAAPAPHVAPTEQLRPAPARQMEPATAIPAAKDQPLRWGGVSTGSR